MAKDTIISVDQLFSKGFVRDEGTNKVPEYFAEEAINIRLVNGGIRIRDGHIERYSDTGVLTPQGIIGNDTTNKLLFVYNGTVYDIDTTTRTATSLGSITSTAKCRFINYGRNTIFLTGDQRPYYYNGDTLITNSVDYVASNSTTMKVNGVSMTPVVFTVSDAATLTAICTQLTTQFPALIATATANAGANQILITPVVGQEVTITDFAVTGGAGQPTTTVSKIIQVTSAELDTGVNPAFGGTFAGFTMINRSDVSNVLSVSRPITLTNQGYCHDWKGTDAYTISFKGELQGTCSTLSRFWVFTDKSIEYLSPSFLDSTGAYVPTTFGDGEQLASPDCVEAAGDIVFFVTKSKKIRSIGYQGTVTEPQIKTISDIEGSGIQRFMQEQLAEDQSQAFIHNDKLNGLIKFWFVGASSNTPDTCLCRDLNASQWIQDMEKNYGSITTLGTRQFASAAVGEAIFEDETGEDDDGQAIQWSFITQNMGLQEPSLVKFWRGFTVAGQIGFETLCRTQVWADDNILFDKYIDGSIENPFGVGGVGDAGIGMGAIGDVYSNQSLLDFEKVVDIGRMRKTGKKIRFAFSGNTIGQRIVLDFLSITYRVRRRRRVKDKRFTSVS